MIFDVANEEAGIIGYFWKGSDLFSCHIDSVVFGEVNMTRDTDESDLVAD